MILYDLSFYVRSLLSSPIGVDVDENRILASTIGYKVDLRPCQPGNLRRCSADRNLRASSNKLSVLKKSTGIGMV